MKRSASAAWSGGLKGARLKDAIERGYQDVDAGKVIRLESDAEIDAFFADL
jgi:hypothetical protein